MSDSPRDTTLRQNFQNWWMANRDINAGWGQRVIAKRALLASAQRKLDREKAQTAQFRRLARIHMKRCQDRPRLTRKS